MRRVLVWIVVVLAGTVWASPASDEAEIRGLVSALANAFDRTDSRQAAKHICVDMGVRLVGVSDPHSLPGSREAKGLYGEESRVALLIDDRLRGMGKTAKHLCAVRKVRFLNADIAVAYIDYRYGDRSRAAFSVVAGFVRNNWGWRWRAIAPMMPTPTEGAHGLLDATEWTIGKEGAVGSDIVVFANSLFFSGTCMKKGFYPATYSARKVGNKIEWVAEMDTYTNQAIVWNGEVSDTRMKGRWMRVGLPEGNPLEPIVSWVAERH